MKTLFKISFTTAWLMLLLPTLYAQTDTIQWSVLMGGSKAGFLKQWKTPDGFYHEWYQYNDRGRGDSTVVHYKVNDKGFITKLDGEGKDYFKKPVFEKFSIENGVAHWENNAEKGEQKLQHDVSYVPLKINAGSDFKAFFASPDSTVTLLPSGKQKLTILRRLTLDNGERLALYRITGTGLTPSYGWMDLSGNYFAYVSDWFSLIRNGNDKYIPQLLDIQKNIQQSYFKLLKQKLTKQQSKVAINNASVFDPATGKLTPDQTILIENGIIKEVSSKKYKLSSDYQVVDASGKFVMPGLWDMHVHYQSGSEGVLHLANGVTNVRDMGNSTALIEDKKEIDNGIVLGPRVQVMSGFIDGAGPFAGPTGEKVNSAEEGIAAVKKYAGLGYQQIKLYSSLKPEWVKPIAEEAHRNKLRVSGHIPSHMLAEEAVQAGYDEIQHMNMIFLNFYGKDLDTRTPARFTTVAQKAAFFDFNSSAYKNFLKLLKEKKVVIDPTVSIFESMFTHEEGKPSASMAIVMDRLPLELQRNLKSDGGLGIPQGLEDTYRKSFNNMLRMVKALYDNGVTIVPGTDDFPGFILHRELENYVKAGIPPAAVLKIATLQSAQVAGKASQYGSIEKNKVADIILIDGDPLKNISDIRKVRTVIKDQDIYQTAELFEAISIKP
jgi:imidazolonepropionase-like amidohydrolase